MKISVKSAASTVCSLQCAIFALTLVVLTAPLGAAPYTFSDENSTAVLDADGGLGLYTYTVDGVDQLSQQWFYYRIGTTGPEAPINNLGAPTVTARGTGDGYDVVYQNGTIQVTVSYWVEGGTSGTGTSLMHADWAVHNLSASTLDFHFFQYSDFDLGGSSSDQSVTFSKVGFPFWNRATQTDGSMIVSNSFQNAQAISKVQVGDAATILASLTDLNTTTLSGTSTAGPGNLAFAAQWDFSLGALNSPTQTRANNELWGLLVPEPSSLALISCGVAALAFVRRRR